MGVNVTEKVHDRFDITPLILYLIVNSLFLLKYCSRITPHAWIFIPVYILFVVMSIAVVKKVSPILEPSPIRIIGAATVFFVFCYLVILHSIDPLSLNVDRWSAISSFVTNLFSGIFPYTGRTHLGHSISGFPGLFLLSMPFQLLGDVGYLQVFGFLCFVFLVNRLSGAVSSKAAVLWCAGTSPVFLWEVAVRSELFSNMVIVILLLYGCETIKAEKRIWSMIVLGACAGLVLSTRGIVLIPFLMYFSGYFSRREMICASVFSISLVISFVSTLLPLYIWAPDLFLTNNPFLLQSSYIPMPFLGAVLVISIIAGRSFRTFDRLLLRCGYVLWGLDAILFLKAVVQEGWDPIVFQHGFDISYFQFPTPFLLLSLFHKRK
jgi:hypothetical protein